jgi:hypothetical protein
MVPFALAGTVLWALAGLVLLFAGAPTDWLWTCLAGVLLGVPGLAIMAVHDRHRDRRRARATGTQP